MVDLEDVRAAAKRIAGQVVRTPLIPSPNGESLWLKPENLQPTGAFKLRGALNAVGSLPAAERARGVVTHSSGNHGRALAWAAREHRVPAVVVMPDDSPQVKIDGVRALGAEVIVVPPVDRVPQVAELAQQRGLVHVPPFDDEAIIAGQGTVGLEIAEDMPSVGTVLVPVGGGGLISGVAVAVKALVPGVRVVGVEPELAGDLAEGFAAGSRVVWDHDLTGRTIADGLRGPAVGHANWTHIAALVDDVVTVSEDAIMAAMTRIVTGSRIVCEPSGAVAAAAFWARPGVASGPTVAIVSGGNVDPALLARMITLRGQSPPSQGLQT